MVNNLPQHHRGCPCDFCVTIRAQAKEIERLERQIVHAESCIGDIYCCGADVSDRTAEYYRKYPNEAAEAVGRG
jgi:hypothetical protein